MNVLIEQHDALVKQITQKQELLADLKCAIDGIIFQLKEKEDLMRIEKESHDELTKQKNQISQQINDELERNELIQTGETLYITSFTPLLIVLFLLLVAFFNIN